MTHFNNILTLNRMDLPLFIAISISIISFLIYWAFYISSNGQGRLVIRARFIGFILFAVLPVGMLILFTNFHVDDIGLILVPESGKFIFISSFLLSVIGIFVTVINPGSVKHFKKYPQIRDPKWSKQIFIWNLISWAVYLTGYEILFRGVILFTTAASVGVLPAIAISTGFYSAFHLQKGFFEAVGAIFLGLLLSFFTIMSGSIWIAVIVHVTMGVSNTLWSFKHHPEMSMKESM